MDAQKQLDLEDVALALRRICSLREQERAAKENVKVLESHLKDARAKLANVQYLLQSKIDDVGGEDGPLFKCLNHG